MSGTSTRPLRRDASDNRERLLAAAETVFAREGVDAAIEQVAREAGVGMGTVYRRFPTKQALIDEVVDGLLDELIAAAAAALPEPDGLERYLRAAGAMLFERRGFLPLVWRGERRAAPLARLRSIIVELVDRAHALGRVSPDVSATDISSAVWSLRGIIEVTHAAAPDAWKRQLDFILAGLRTGADHYSAPPLTFEQVDAIVTPAD